MEELAAGEPKWRAHDEDNFGLTLAHRGSAAAAGIDWTRPFSSLIAPGAATKHSPARIGLDSRVVGF